MERLVVALVVLGASVVALHFRWYDVLDRMVFDTIIRLTPLPPDERIVLVGIDARSLSRVGRWPWPRAEQATLIDQVNQHHPAAVLVDVLYTDQGSAEDDQRLVAAAANTDVLVMPVVIDAVTSGGTCLNSCRIRICWRLSMVWGMSTWPRMATGWYVAVIFSKVSARLIGRTSG
jgi:CHASE2 domain-containing sensor protein